MEIIYEHNSQISSMDFSNDEQVIGFGDIDGVAIMLEGEDYEMIYTIKVPNEKVNAVKCDRNSGNFIFGFDYNLKICDSKGNIYQLKF